MIFNTSQFQNEFVNTAPTRQSWRMFANNERAHNMLFLYPPIRLCFDLNSEPRPYSVPKRLLSKEMKKLGTSNNNVAKHHIYRNVQFRVVLKTIGYSNVKNLLI